MNSSSLRLTSHYKSSMTNLDVAFARFWPLASADTGTKVTRPSESCLVKTAVFRCSCQLCWVTLKSFISHTPLLHIILLLLSLSRRKKSRIRETKNLSTDADSRTYTMLERLRGLFLKKKNPPKSLKQFSSKIF